MAQADTTPRPGDVRPCSECGHMTAEYAPVPNSLFAPPDQDWRLGQTEETPVTPER